MSTISTYYDFFTSYAEKKPSILQAISVLKQGSVSQKEHGLYLQHLVAQIEAGKQKIEELSAQKTVDPVQIAMVFKEVKRLYKELRQHLKPVWRQWLEAIVLAGLGAFFIRTYLFGLYHVPSGSAEPNLLVGDRLFGNKLIYNFYDVSRGELVIFDNPEFTYDKNSAIQRWWQRYIGLPVLGLLKQGPDNWVKRVIGVPGDTVEGRVEDGKTVIYLNGKKLDEPYVNPYPLLLVRRKSGLADPESFMGSFLPRFLHTQGHYAKYTYDPDKPYDQQPYYQVANDELLFTHDGERLLFPAGEPELTGSGRNADIFGPITVPEGHYWVQGDSRRNSRDSRWWGLLDKKLVQGRASFTLFSLDSEESFWLFEFIKNPVRFFTTRLRWSRFFKGLVAVPDLRKLRAPAEKQEGGN